MVYEKLFPFFKKDVCLEDTSIKCLGRFQADNFQHHIVYNHVFFAKVSKINCPDII